MCWWVKRLCFRVFRALLGKANGPVFWFGSFCGGGCNQALELRVGGCLFRFFGAAGAAVAVVGGASITLLLVSKRLR